MLRGTILYRQYYEVLCTNCPATYKVYDCTLDEFVKNIAEAGWSQEADRKPWRCPNCSKEKE